MENHHFWWENQGFRLGHVLFSYVRNYQRVDFGVELDSITTYQNLSNWFKLIQTHWELRIVRRDGEKTALLPWGNRCLRHAVRRAQTRILKMKEALQLRNVRWGYGMILPKSWGEVWVNGSSWDQLFCQFNSSSLDKANTYKSMKYGLRFIHLIFWNMYSDMQSRQAPNIWDLRNLSRFCTINIYYNSKSLVVCLGIFW